MSQMPDTRFELPSIDRFVLTRQELGSGSAVIACAAKPLRRNAFREIALALQCSFLLSGRDPPPSPCLPSATVAPPFTISSLWLPVTILVPKYRQLFDISLSRKARISLF